MVAFIVGQTDADSAAWNEVITWSGILVAVLLVGLVGVALTRRWMTKADEGQPDGFTLDGLRLLHKLGEIDDAEFARAKAALIAKLRPVNAPESDDPAVRAVRELRGRSDKTPPPPPAIDGPESPV